MTDFEKLVYELRLAQSENSTKHDEESLKKMMNMEKKVDTYLHSVIDCLKYQNIGNAMYHR